MIFLSYSRKDSEFVLDIAKTLRDAGANIWLDQLDIEPGTSWDDSVENALQNSDTLLIFLSNTSVNSKNVRDEYSYAFDEKKRIVPVLIEDCTIPFRLRRLQYADFTQERSIGLKTLLDTLNLDNNNLSDQPKEDENSFKSSPKKKKEYPKFKYLGIAALALAVLYIFISNNFFVGSKEASQVTILVHGETGKDHLVLPNRGQVKLIYGGASEIETINSKGEATFKQIPGAFFEDNASVEILFIDPEGEPYRSISPDSIYNLKQNDYISLTVKLFGLENIRGIVKDFESGDPISNARISISGIEAFSNEYGEYSLQIPPDAQQKYQTIRAYKEGYELYEISNVPIQANQELPIVMKQKKSQ